MTESTVPDPDDETLAIIESFRRPEYRVIDMERDGFTHLETECASCGQIVGMPFDLLRERQGVKDNTALARRYRCSHCNGRTIVGGLPQPSYQYMATPDDEDDDSPVNRLRQGRD